MTLALLICMADLTQEIVLIYSNCLIALFPSVLSEITVTKKNKVVSANEREKQFDCRIETNGKFGTKARGWVASVLTFFTTRNPTSCLRTTKNSKGK